MLGIPRKLKFNTKWAFSYILQLRFFNTNYHGVLSKAYCFVSFRLSICELDMIEFFDLHSLPKPFSLWIGFNGKKSCSRISLSVKHLIESRAILGMHTVKKLSKKYRILISLCTYLHTYNGICMKIPILIIHPPRGCLVSNHFSSITKTKILYYPWQWSKQWLISSLTCKKK